MSVSTSCEHLLLTLLPVAEPRASASGWIHPHLRLIPCLLSICHRLLTRAARLRACGSASGSHRLATLLMVAACSVTALYGQGPARDLYISSPTPIIVSGDKAQLSAATRDAQGIARPNDTFTWTSNAPAILSVDSRGMVTANGIGTATITVATPTNVRGTMRLEVAPSRIRMTPASGQMFVGETVPFKAEALDINGEPIPNVTFTWQLTGANGFQINSGSLSRDGKLTANGLGLFTVRALLSVTGLPSGPFVNQFVGLARVEAKRKPEFKLTRLLTTARVRPTSQLRRLRYITANDAGQITAIGILDGVSEGLLLFENGRWDVLFSTGLPGSQSGTSVRSLDFVSMNGSGEVLFRTGEAGGPGAIMLASRSEARIVFMSGQSAGEIENINNIALSRRSLNEAGDFVFRANYRASGSTVNRTGLFKISRGALQPLWLSADPLTGLGAAYSFRDNFGIDAEGTVYFLADDGRKRAVYRADGLGRPTPIISGGDKLDAFLTIQDIDNFNVSPSGDVAFRATIAQQSLRLVRIARGSTTPQNVSVPNMNTIFSVGSTGLLFRGDAGKGYGLYRWQSGEPAPVAVALDSRIAPNGEPQMELFDAVSGAAGVTIVHARTANTPFLAFSAGSQASTLFGFGARVNGFSNVSADTFIRGDLMGPPDLRFGNSGGVFQVDGQTLHPRFVTGDKLPGGAIFRNYQLAVKSPSGDLYTPADDGMYRMTGSRLTRVFAYPAQSSDKVSLSGTFNFSVNDAGAIVSDNRAGDHSRLNITENGRAVMIASNGQNAKYATSLPSGGTVNGWRDLTIDAGGRVMAFLTTASAGPQGYFLYANDTWKPAVLINSTQFPGQVVTGLDNLRARGDKFYARILFRSGSHMVAEYGQDGWKTLLTRSDDVNGVTLQNVDGFDVNRRGDLAVIANLGSYRAVLMYADGAVRTVHLGNETAAGGESLTAFWEIEVRDDRRIYFFGIDADDYEYVYLAEPLF
ncbi:MAG: hypothetical protein EXQ52_16880 [Bryobacterales bacterium]|nr:hypothetical protein [Bryobacterales bacterium]